VRMRPPRIIRKTLALRGAQGRRFISDSTILRLCPVYSPIALESNEPARTHVRHADRC
jgi:hypothetical protein